MEASRANALGFRQADAETPEVAQEEVETSCATASGSTRIEAAPTDAAHDDQCADQHGHDPTEMKRNRMERLSMLRSTAPSVAQEKLETSCATASDSTHVDAEPQMLQKTTSAQIKMVMTQHQ